MIALLHVAAGERLWEPPRNFVFDAYQRFFPRNVTRFPVAIVDIDERSLQSFGRWPWPRARVAQLIEAAHQFGALAIGLDMIMPEADRLSPQELLADRKDVDPALRAKLDELPSNDAILADMLRRMPSVLARAGLLVSAEKTAPPRPQTPVQITGESPINFLSAFPGEIANIAQIEQAAKGRGYVNDTRDRDGVVRTMPLVLAVNGVIAPSLALEILRVATGERIYEVRGDRAGALGVQIGSSFIPTDRDGRIRLHFSPPAGDRRVSASTLLDGTAKPGALKNQVAIIGVTGVGVADVAPTPIHSGTYGVEIQAQFIENILAGTRLLRPQAAPWWELFALCGIVLPMIGLSRRMLFAAAIFLGGTVLLFGSSVLLFLFQRSLYDATFPAVGSALTFLLLLLGQFAVSERRRHELGLALEEERVERLRVAGELRAARDIQMGMLPDPRTIENLPPTIDFFALLEPAQEVGGDLYDAFMIDSQRLCFIIGDVSGKGVPASLFMALTKTLSKSLARRQEMPLERVMRLINEEVSRENPASMFVTIILGVLDTATGAVELCNAGHNAPIRLSPGEGPLEQEGAAGPPLCLDEEFPYTTQRLQLASGDMLILFTDGVTEAENEQQNHYGTARAVECFGAMPEDAAAACAQLHADVKRFIGGAPQSDDLAIVAIGMKRQAGGS